MGQNAAKQGDRIKAVDSHLVQPASGPPVATPFPFDGPLSSGLSGNVRIGGQWAATVDSAATNTPPHPLPPPGAVFVFPPSNRGTIKQGSATVKINGKAAARNGDAAATCNDTPAQPVDLPIGKVVAIGTVRIGD